MFAFPTTRMIREAQAAPMPALAESPARQSLVYCLVFLIAILAQSVLQIPFILWRALSSDALQNTASLDFAALSEEISRAMENLMPARLYTTVGTIAVCIFYCRRFEGRNLFSMGFVKKGAITEYAAGLGIGLAMFGLSVGLCVATGHMTVTLSPAPAYGMLLLYFLGYLMQGMSEEILCRGFLMVSMQRNCPTWAAILLNSLIFALLHLGNPGVTPLALVNLAMFGFFASFYTLRRGSIWGIGAIHAVWNFAQGNLFGISVSGMGGNPSLLTAATSEGGRFMHGGTFGMEGGLAVTAVMAIGCMIILLCKTKKGELAENSPKEQI